MKAVLWLSVLVASVLPQVASAHSDEVRWHTALASFEHVSSDGCVHTVGEFVLHDSPVGAENAPGVYIVGSEEDVCAGTGNGFAAFVPVDVQVQGLLYGRYRGKIVAESYSSGEAITFDLNLTWAGHGAITRDRNEWDDNGVVNFAFTARRAARTYGAVRANGVPMTITSATLTREVRGTVAR